MDRVSIKNDWEIWSEGYRATGECGGAWLMNKDKDGKLISVEGNNFKEACINWFTKHEIGMKQNYSNTYINDHWFDQDRMMYWACELFDNEKDAREAFG